MNENNHTPQMSEQQPWEQNTYQTGSTCPPKNYRTVIAVLLAAVIFLGGIVSALGLMNIRLFRQLQEEKQPEVASFRFSHEECTRSTVVFEGDFLLPVLGFSGQEVSTFDQLSYRIPLGLYITRVLPDSEADMKGILAGDILIALDGKRVLNTGDLQLLLPTLQEGQTISVLLYRDGHQYKLDLTLGGV